MAETTSQTDGFYAHLRDRANTVAAELHRRLTRLHELGTDPERRNIDAEHVVRGETIGMRNALGILLQPPGGSTPAQRFIEHVGDNYYREWAREQQAEPALHLGNKANAEDCPACAIERRNLPYPFLCPAEPADEAHLAASIDAELAAGQRAQKQVQRLDQMAAAWAERLPEAISRDTVVEAIHQVTRPEAR